MGNNLSNENKPINKPINIYVSPWPFQPINKPMDKPIINEQLCSKVLDIVDKGLTAGLGRPEPGKMCVEAAVCYALDLPHSDDPPCVGYTVKSFKINLNDLLWPSNEERSKGMRKLAIAQLGSDQIDQQKFAEYVTIETIKRILPIALDKVDLPDHAIACRKITTIQEAQEVTTSATTATRIAAATAAAVYASSDTAVYAVFAYASAARNAARAARDAAHVTYDTTTTASICASTCVAASISTAVADPVNKLEILQLSAQIGLEALIKLESPGCKFLYLC
jgi:hypothetical protein